MELTWIAIDTETHLISPGVLAPPMVCLSLAQGAPPKGSLYLRSSGLDKVEGLLLSPEIGIVGANIAYDMGVIAAARPSLIPLIFRAYEEGRIRDVQIREKLVYLAKGWLSFSPMEKRKPSFSLASLVRRRLGLDISESKGEDSWRLRYSELEEVPLESWPEEARDYAINDAVYTLEVYPQEPLSLGGSVVVDANNNVTNEGPQTRAAWGLHLMSVWGMVTDPEKVAALREELEPRVAQMERSLLEAGLLRESGSKNLTALRERVSAAYEGEPPLTAKGAVSTAKDTLVNSGDSLLIELGSDTAAAKILSTYVPVLEAGVVNPSYSVLLETGRTSSFNPNIQNVPRAGGVRSCYVPRPGRVYVAVDYNTLELCSLSQVCLDMLGYSRMGEAINSGLDLHLVVASQLLGIPYEEAQERRGEKVVKEARQIAKVANFGYPGGMGATSFISYAKGYGLDITEETAQVVMDTYLSSWEEMGDYFHKVSSMLNYSETCTVTQLRSNRVRGATRYSAACNGFMQSLAADGAKEAIWRVAKDCYTNPSSPLWGCRPVAFIHDEIIISAPREVFSAAANRLQEIMVEAMEVYIPDIKITTEAVAMESWEKDAEPLYNDKGELLIWTP